MGSELEVSVKISLSRMGLKVWERGEGWGARNSVEQAHTNGEVVKGSETGGDHREGRTAQK